MNKCYRAGKITRISKLRQLNEIYAGACEGMSYDEIREKMPQVRSRTLQLQY